MKPGKAYKNRGTWIMKNIDFYKEELKKCTVSDTRNVYFPSERGVMSFLNITSFIDWLRNEHQVLDDTEKRYLCNLIAPFTCQVRCFQKAHIGEKECIITIYEENGNIRSFTLPYFKAGTMFKGMEPDIKFTPEELGLFDE